jgi:hypothetical protein
MRNGDLHYEGFLDRFALTHLIFTHSQQASIFFTHTHFLLTPPVFSPLNKIG